ncbi:hypothetical protein [Stomatohabitans albus]|uniref:hypothetical protein n=1 Tax=Stomatohabitans albus TaxID=3110766 RepID=UPI00300C1D07
MSSLDQFIPQPNDPADLPAALRKFAEWIEQQKTAMAEQVRAEVAKVDQATITANVLAQIPDQRIPDQVDVFTKELNWSGVEPIYTVTVPTWAEAVRISIRGGAYIAREYREKLGEYILAPMQTVWYDLRYGFDKNEFSCHLGDSRSDMGGRNSYVLWRHSDQSDFELVALGVGQLKPQGDPSGFEVTNPRDAQCLGGTAIFEWFKKKPVSDSLRTQIH